MSGLSQRTCVKYATLDDWIQHEALTFSLDSIEDFNAAVDQMVATFDPSVQLLGFGEPTHKVEDFLVLRNRLFQRLVEAHSYTAIALESSFPRGRLANEYVTGRTAEPYEVIQAAGFSHAFGAMKANRDLVEWMRQYNADPAHPVKIHFYGFDSPTEMYGTDSPRQVLEFVLTYLASVDAARGRRYRQRIEPLLGEDAAWENPATMTDPTQSIGQSPNAVQLRIETEELIAELLIHRPEYMANSDQDRFLEALQVASVARQLLTYHAGLAQPSEDRFVRLAGLRDAMMADLLMYIVSRERSRGKVLAFAHNSHLKHGGAEWQYGADFYMWWSAGSHVSQMLGQAYAVIGTGVGRSEVMGIGQPEAGTLEAGLTAAPGHIRLIPTHFGKMLPESVIGEMPTRSAPPVYFPLNAQSFTDFDWLCVLDAADQ